MSTCAGTWIDFKRRRSVADSPIGHNFESNSNAPDLSEWQCEKHFSVNPEIDDEIHIR
jgi:hypothetical protein